MSREDRIIGIVALFLLIPLTIWGVFYYRAALEQPLGAKGFNIFLGGIFTLALYSILYRENPVYRMAEHILLGLSAGYLVVAAWNDTLESKWYTPIAQDGQWLWLWMIPLVAMAYLVFHKKHGWISRIPLVILSGFVAGQVFQAFVAQYFKQIADSFRPVWPNVPSLRNPNPTPDTLSISGAINNLIFLVVLLSVLSYFFFSFEQKKEGTRKFAQLGRWMLMIGFGAIFGSTIMTRFALFVDRMFFLLIQWLKLGGPTTGG